MKAGVRIAVLASQHALPAVALFRDFPEAGGLLSYGPSMTAAYRIKGNYAGRILKGERRVTCQSNDRAN